MMKRLMLTAVLLAGGVTAARPDTDVWSGKGSNADLDAADGSCRQQFGPNPPGVPTSPEYKGCMRRLGWKFVKTQHDGTWQRGGMTCHYILNGYGSECDAN